MKTVLVTGAGGPLGVNFCRSLRKGDSGLRIIGTEANRFHLPLSICDETYLISYAKERDAYASALREVASKEGVTVLIPTHPAEVRAVAELRDSGNLGELRTALPKTSVLDISDDKAKTQKALEEAGLSVPRTRVLHDRGALERAFDELRKGEEPVWVRGSGAPGVGLGGAALPCRELEVARAWIDHHDGWGKMAASEYLPGRNLTWMGLFSQGTLVAAGARERLEYVLPHVSPSGITGAPAVSRTLRDPKLEQLGERAVRAIDGRAHGVYFVDFKGDPSEMPRVTEINGGRCGTTIHFYTEAGFNFPHALTELADKGELSARAKPNEVIAEGMYWVRTLDCGPALVKEADFHRYPEVLP